MIVGTAGHIDHGKTALVRALTGIDADRLPEEKRRGITIELGYAWMAAPDGARVGFVDVPGHEKLVRTMVAGASGIDLGLLLVAADDGVMPQTVEHATILSLLQVERGIAVITKTDRVDAARLDACEAGLRALLSQLGLDGYPVVRVSALRGDGVDALRDRLLDAARMRPATRQGEAGFRMALDRAFTVAGVGTVVAGSIAAGTVRVGDMRVGDSLCLASDPDRHYRVRSLQVHERPAEEAHAGQRCALGLAGLERSDALRGQLLCDPAIAFETDRFDAWLTVAPGEAAPLRSGTLVHLHSGTRDCMATLAVLGQAALAPGQEGPVQLLAHKPLTLWHGDRFILRDAGATRTVAGGMVLDPAAPARYRQTPQRLAWLDSQRQPDPIARLRASLDLAPFGLDGKAWLRHAGLAAWPVDPISLDDVVAGGDGWLIAGARLRESERAVLAALEAFHARYPEEIGPGLQRARRLAAPRMPDALWARLVEHMAASGALGLRNGFLHLPEHGSALREAERLVAERALPLLLDGRFDPPWVRDIAATARLSEQQVRQVLGRLGRAGEVYQIVKDLYYHPAVVRELAELARTLAQSGGNVTAARFRDATGLGRKRAIQILEFFDRIGFLRRVGDLHLPRTGTTLFLDASS